MAIIDVFVPQRGYDYINEDEYIHNLTPEEVRRSLARAPLNILARITRLMTLEQYLYCRTTLDAYRVAQIEAVWNAIHAEMER